jgi:hypothetical protein
MLDRVARNRLEGRAVVESSSTTQRRSGPAPTRAPAQRAPRQEKGTTDYLQSALQDLSKARESATEDVREAIDAASERVRVATRDATDRAQGEVGDWRRALEQAGEDLRRELGLLAVRAQDSPEALSAMSAEIRKRKAQLEGR